MRQTYVFREVRDREVMVEHDQKIIKTGLYRLVRHPSYLGAYTAIIGCSLLLHTTIGLFTSAFIMMVAYLYRIHVEEQTLVDELGADYRQYQEKTARLIPFLY
jgi:protein-S-isoprenylcysteine O-methyltransferase Ste14